jgi:hypothetical protein
MPKLLIFAACEKVIIGQDNMPSLIGILQGLNIHAPDPVPEDKPALVPLQWCAFSSWLNEGDEPNTTYEQRVVLFDDSGSPVFENCTQFQMTKPQHRIYLTSHLFPLLPEGTHRVLLFLRKVSEAAWTEVASYPLQVSHIVVPKVEGTLESRP